MLRYILVLILLVLVARAFWRIVDGVIAGVRKSSGSPPVPTAGVAMERDPVCGTFVIPQRAIVLGVGERHLYFCSTACRDQYRARSA
jgi:YHS domain-containing protein